MESATARTIKLERLSLWNGRRTPQDQDIIRITRRWCEANHDLLSGAQYIVIEKQLRPLFQTMATVINTLYFDQTVQVSANTIAAHFELPRKRKEKKAATIALVEDLGVVFAQGKQDDLADAYLMALWKVSNTKI